MSARLLAALAFAALAGGCGDEKKSVTLTRATAGPAAAGGLAVKDERAAGHGGGADGPAATPPAVPRKVIFNATLDLKVDDVEKAVAKLRVLVGQMNGYVSKSDVSGTPGARTGTLTARVPSNQFPAAVEQFATLGTVNRSASDSQDVTEEFIDAEARLKNYKAEEVALNKLLDASGVRLEDIFKIREQIARNRAEVERIEGRLKYLGSQTELSTLTLTLREDKAPGPPPPPPVFSSRLSRQFYWSLGELQLLGENLLLLAVTVAPWLPVIVFGVWLAYRSLRWFARMSTPPERRRRPVQVATPLPDSAVAADVPKTTESSGP